MKIRIPSKALSIAAVFCAILLSACGPRVASESTILGVQASTALQDRVNAAVRRWMGYTAAADTPVSVTVETEPDRAAICKAFATINHASDNPNCTTQAFAIVGSRQITALETSSDNTLLHEVGHSLGLWHTPSSADIMFHAETRLLTPSPTDIASIRAVFGEPAGELSLHESGDTDVSAGFSFGSDPTLSGKACGLPLSASTDAASNSDSAATSKLETTKSFADAGGA